MIRLENTLVQGWEAAIRGMRNPMNSWDKSDSHACYCQLDGSDCVMVEEGHEPALECNDGKYGFCIGENDMALMKKLVKAGSDHRKFLRFITVAVDITAPLYWWKEFDTYKVGTVANSCSTMHKIHAKEFTLEDFSHEHVVDMGEHALMAIVQALNYYRDWFLKTNDKEYWWQMIQLLPTSYNQRRTVLLNYEVLRNMYHARKAHKLSEWSEGFCGWVETLPYAKELICDVG